MKAIRAVFGQMIMALGAIVIILGLGIFKFGEWLEG